MIAWVVAFSGCTTGTTPIATGDRPSPQTNLPSPTVPSTDTALDTGTGTTTSPAADLAIVAALIDGEISAEDALHQIAWSGGWPVRDGEMAWFVHASIDGPWSVAGDFNEWAPEPMTAGDGFSWAAVEVGSDPAGLGYKFVGPGEVWIADPTARSYAYDDYGELSYVAPPSATPRLDRWPGLRAEGLAPRDLAIWVPSGAGPWPVIYAHDGQNLFDPGAIWGGWRLGEALSVRDPILVVGIGNTPDRFDEYTHVPDDIGHGGLMGGNGDAYAALVESAVRPHVEAVYGSTGHDGVLGSSLGGLISLHIAWRYPERYDFVASLSGTLGWGRIGADNETIAARWTADRPMVPAYVDSGGGPGANGCEDPDGDGSTADDPDATDNYCTTRHFADALADNGHTWEVDLWHWWEPDAPHAEIAWADRVGMPLDRFLSLR